MSEIDRINDDIRSINEKINDIGERLSEMETETAVDKEKATVAMGDRLKLRKDLNTVLNKFKVVAKKFQTIDKRHDREDDRKIEERKKKAFWKKVWNGVLITVLGGLTLLLLTKGVPPLIKWIASLLV
jgi:hypothetical protein